MSTILTFCEHPSQVRPVQPTCLEWVHNWRQSDQVNINYHHRYEVLAVMSLQTHLYEQKHFPIGSMLVVDRHINCRDNIH